MVCPMTYFHCNFQTCQIGCGNKINNDLVNGISGIVLLTQQTIVTQWIGQMYNSHHETWRLFQWRSVFSNSTEITGNDQFNKEASRFQKFQCNHKEILFNLTTQHIQCDRWPRTDRGHLELLPSLILLSFVLQHQTAEEAQ